MKVLLNIILLASSLVFPFSPCIASSSEDESLVTYRFKVRRADFDDYVHRVFVDPKVVSMDFSSLGLTDRDLDVIFDALVERKKVTRASRVDLIDLRGGRFGEEDVLRFLKNLENGKKESGETIYPNVQGTVLKIGLVLTDEFVEALQNTAPNMLFEQKLRIVE
jgi:hypothetical protein